MVGAQIGAVRSIPRFGKFRSAAPNALKISAVSK